MPPAPVLHILHCGDPFLGRGGKLRPGAAPSSSPGWQTAEFPVFTVGSHPGPPRDLGGPLPPHAGRKGGQLDSFSAGLMASCSCPLP